MSLQSVKKQLSQLHPQLETELQNKTYQNVMSQTGELIKYSYLDALSIYDEQQLTQLIKASLPNQNFTKQVNLNINASLMLLKGKLNWLSE